MSLTYNFGLGTAKGREAVAGYAIRPALDD
jgi:hypothetical protein